MTLKTLLEMTDGALVTMTLGGEQSAYEALVVRWQKNVLSAAASVTHNRYSAEDAAQDAFVSAWLKLDTLREPEKYGSWVCRIAKNRARDLITRCRDWISVDFMQLAEREKPEYFGLCENGEGEELHESVSALSEKVRAVVELHYFEGLSVGEIADRLSIPAGTVKWRLHEGRAKLRKDYGMGDIISDVKDDATLTERVMAEVEALRRWAYKNKKDGFAEKYRETLAGVEALSDSDGKYFALADVLVRGCWWLPKEEKPGEELFKRIYDAAERGFNEEAMMMVFGKDMSTLSGAERMNYIRDKQLPRARALGMKKLEAYLWFWYGRECFVDKRPDEGFAAYEKTLRLLTPGDEYYANALSAITLEKRCAELDPTMYCANTYAMKLRRMGGALLSDAMPGYWKGDGRSYYSYCGVNFILGCITGCDRLLFDTSMKPGDTYCSEDGISTLTFKSATETMSLPCGDFDGCELWETADAEGVVYETWYKRGVGVLSQRVTKYGRTKSRYLSAYHIEGGDGPLPLAAGNRWEYADPDKRPDDNSELIVEFGVTCADDSTATLSGWWLENDTGYREDSWNDMTLKMRRSYCVDTENGAQKLCDVSDCMERAEALAKTPFEKLYTKAACGTMRRIFATDREANPDREAEGLWNFFICLTVLRGEDKISLRRNGGEYDFEWKDMSGADLDDPRYPLLYNMLYDTLEELAGGIWNDKWTPGYEEKVYFRAWDDDYDTVSALSVSDGGEVVTAAGTFADCLRLTASVSGTSGGLDYYNGERYYYYAPGVGIVRASFTYGAEKTVDYDLVSYTGTGEGYFPLGDGFERHYRAAGLTDGCEAGSDNYFTDDGRGGMMLFTDAIGIKHLI